MVTFKTPWDLARLRQKGPVWRLIAVVDGFDERFTGSLPGKLSENFARGYFENYIAHGLRVPRKHVCVTEAWREGG